MELDDLKAAVQGLTQAVTDVTAELNAVSNALIAIKNQTTINPADVEAQAQAVQVLANNLEAAVSSTKTSTGV